MERPTRLELATSTLARWRSTRWATAAHVSIASSDACYYNRPFPKSQGFSCILFHIFSNLFSFPISNSRAFPVTFFPLVLSPGPRSGFLHLHRYSYYVASYALFLHPWKQINCCLFYSFLGQHRTIPALRLKHRSGSCGTASALPKCSIRHPVLSALLA